MSPLIITFWTVAVALGWLVGYDIYRLCKYGVAGTISTAMYRIGKKYPIVPFVIGHLTGGMVWGLAVHFWG